MNIEEIKVGETYYVRVKVTATSENRFACRPLLWGCTMSDFAPNYFNFAEAEAFYKSIPETTPPKHDPCRLFKKGDRVKTRSVFGRKIYIDDALYEVMWDESCNKISVKDLTSAETLVGMPSVFFELVTPVEELEPYYVEEQDPCYVVGKRQEAPEMEYVAGFSKTRHPNAKAAAEAERDRLNAEWRKEQTNE